jgi:hypothetical protein
MPSRSTTLGSPASVPSLVGLFFFLDSIGYKSLISLWFIGVDKLCKSAIMYIQIKQRGQHYANYRNKRSYRYCRGRLLE